MSARHPDGARLLATFPVVYRAHDDRYLIESDGALWTPFADAAVRVEPAPVELPTGFGARIRATVTYGGTARRDVLLVLCDTDDRPWRSLRVIGGSRWHAEFDLSDVEVLDAGEPSGRERQPHPAAEATAGRPAAGMTPDEAADIIARFNAMDDGGDMVPRVVEAYRVHREHYARHATEDPDDVPPNAGSAS